MQRTFLSAIFALAFALPVFADDAPRVGIVLTNHTQLGDTGKPTGFYLSEAAWPWKTFTEAGFEVVWLSPKGGVAHIDPISLGEEDSASVAFLKTMTKDGHTVTTNKIEGHDAKSFSAIFVAGGHGTMWDLPQHKPLQKLLAGVYENDGVVAAVCHGPTALLNVKLSDGKRLIAGKQVAAFTDAEEEAIGLSKVMPFLLSSTLESHGAKLVDAEKFTSNVVVSGRLVTGQNAISAEGTAEAVAKLMKTK
ncbi:MAG: type 1 glutamine amidotransferase domain-containing protein [Rubripirellula sp.]